MGFGELLLALTAIGCGTGLLFKLVDAWQTRGSHGSARSSTELLAEIKELRAEIRELRAQNNDVILGLDSGLQHLDRRLTHLETRPSAWSSTAAREQTVESR